MNPLGIDVAILVLKKSVFYARLFRLTGGYWRLRPLEAERCPDSLNNYRMNG